MNSRCDWHTHYQLMMNRRRRDCAQVESAEAAPVLPRVRPHSCADVESAPGITLPSIDNRARFLARKRKSNSPSGKSIRAEPMSVNGFERSAINPPRMYFFGSAVQPNAGCSQRSDASFGTDHGFRASTPSNTSTTTVEVSFPRRSGSAAVVSSPWQTKRETS